MGFQTHIDFKRSLWLVFLSRSIFKFLTCHFHTLFPFRIWREKKFQILKGKGYESGMSKFWKLILIKKPAKAIAWNQCASESPWSKLSIELRFISRSCSHSALRANKARDPSNQPCHHINPKSHFFLHQYLTNHLVRKSTRASIFICG